MSCIVRCILDLEQAVLFDTRPSKREPIFSDPVRDFDTGDVIKAFRNRFKPNIESRRNLIDR
jgi:hypothetical protein